MKSAAEIIAAALQDLEETPFLSRLKVDKSGFEVIRQDNANWRTVINDEQTVMSVHQTEDLADARCAEHKAMWRAELIIAALAAHGFTLEKVK